MTKDDISAMLRGGSLFVILLTSIICALYMITSRERDNERATDDLLRRRVGVLTNAGEYVHVSGVLTHEKGGSNV
jgi:hypothetical protein